MNFNSSFTSITIKYNDLAICECRISYGNITFQSANIDHFSRHQELEIIIIFLFFNDTYIFEQIRVTDINDNCPFLNVSTFILEPRPALKSEPSVYLQATDIDSTVNAEIIYTVGTPSFE